MPRCGARSASVVDDPVDRRAPPSWRGPRPRRAPPPGARSTPATPACRGPTSRTSRCGTRITLLREFRGDGHIACLVDAGLDGIDALVVHAASGDVPRAALQTSRGWDDAAWEASVGRLAARGLVDDSGAFTEAGAALRQHIEDQTDALALAPWALLGEEGCDELRTPGAAAQQGDRGERHLRVPVMTKV